MHYKLAYLCGPVDAEEVHRQWSGGGHTKLFGTSYLMQFFDVCTELEAEAFVITTLPGLSSRNQLGNVTVENRPLPTGRGLFYHLGMLWWMLALAPALMRFRPSAMVLTANQNYWFVLSYLKLIGTELIPSAHCVLWRPYSPMPRHWRPLLWLDGLFLRLFVRRAMAVSAVAGSQIEELAKSRRLNVEVLTPTYRRDHFHGIAPPDYGHRPFRVLFGGRTETNKGIFDLVSIAARLNRERPGEFVFDICGDGSELDRLRAEVRDRDLEDVMQVHGFCDRDELSGYLSRSHIVVVPTRSDFEEGLPKSCAEAVLAGRPFITSPVSPLLATLGAAAIEVRPDDATAYYDAIVALADDAELYRAKCAACFPLQPQFYDPGRGYKAALLRQLARAGVARQQGTSAPLAAG